MKFLKKVDYDFSLKSLFDEHISKFDYHHRQELLFLDDIKNFISKKWEIERIYSNSMVTLCEEFMAKKYAKYPVNGKQTNEYIEIPQKWRHFLENILNIAEKRLASAASLMLYCDVFEQIIDQKNESSKQTVEILRKTQNELVQMQQKCSQSYKKYCFEELFQRSLLDELKLSKSDLKKTCSKKGLNFQHLIEFQEKVEKKHDRKKHIDLFKIDYLIANNTLNKLMQHYISGQIADLLQLQNGNMDLFVMDTLNIILDEECKISKFILDVDTQFKSLCSNNNDKSLSANSDHFLFNDLLLMDKVVEFDDLVQFDVQISSNHTNVYDDIDKTNAKYFTYDFKRWEQKLDEFRSFINETVDVFDKKCLPENDSNQITPSKSDLKELPENDEKPKFLQTEDLTAHNRKVALLEAKFQMVELNAKIDILNILEVSNEIEKNDDVRFTYEQLIKLKHELNDYMSSIECRYLVESMIGTVEKPLIPPDDYDLINDTWK